MEKVYWYVQNCGLVNPNGLRALEGFTPTAATQSSQIHCPRVKLWLAAVSEWG